MLVSITKGSRGIHYPCCLFVVLANYGLFSVVLVGNGQLLAALCAAGSQHATTILRCHALAETMLVHAATVVGLKCSFHCLFIVLFCCRFMLWGAKVHIIFEITKNYAIFRHKNCVFLYFICNFAALFSFQGDTITIILHIQSND